MEIDKSIREHIHIQKYTFRFHSETLSPITSIDPTTKAKIIGKPRFSVEPMVYISGTGWEIVNPMETGNEFMIGFRNYVRLKEIMGYEHTGLTSDEITNTLNSLWDMNIDE